jgi:uncharacterized protein involved in exopolysaccharide biosynthesis
MLDSKEFSPYAYFTRVMNYWWLVAVATILGGVIGFIFYQVRPPIYEATATYIVTIDLDRFPIKDTREDMLQYNEDMALNSTKAVLLSTEVRDSVIAQANEIGISLSPYDLLNNYTIERKHDIWELRFRSQSASRAQAVVNIWSQVGYEAMQSWQKAGKTPVYVIFQPPTEALLPQQPVLYDRNRVMLAGATIGFIAGIFSTHLIGKSFKQAYHKTQVNTVNQ